MDLSAVGSITAYVKSIKTTESVRSHIETGFADCRSKDTADFSARARAEARRGRTQPSAEEILGKIEEMKQSAEKQSAEKTAETADKNAVESAAEKPEDVTKSISEMVKEQMEKLDKLFAEKEYDKANDSRLTGIKAKMRTGSGLTPSEQQYLASKDPEAYSSFQKTESAKKMYRCSLNACRTKDEVNAMRLSNALSALAAYKKSIRGGGDGADVAGLNAALDREIRSFTGSANYRRLPTVAECNKFDRDLAKAKRNEREKKLAEKRARELKKKRTLAAKRLAAKRAKYKKTPGDGKQTVAQVLSSPTAKKVLASRAKSNYCGCAEIGSYNGVSRLYSKA
ncbi:MAG: hypothetical protein NC299_00885 [Lachnospiraceae bacterium]|nr:hypothetical protein [Ruminococcus sp.]MCM1273902.1 hypothetical protein [Lachnospiraceae bacterium]